MKKLWILWFALAPVWLFGQFSLALEPVAFPEAPPVQSYAWAQHDGYWLIVGGRIDGLHRRQPFAAFDTEGRNTAIIVLHPEQQQVWTAPLADLPVPIREQLRSTNMQFAQDGDHLYLTGGYAYSETAGDHITFPYLTKLNVPEIIDAVVAGESIAPFIHTFEDERMAVTGGYLYKLGDDYYLVGGHRFDGRYNPHGPDHGPGFSQEYTDEVRRFRIGDEGGVPGVLDYEAWHDELHLHRRDYNLVPQIFPDGSRGLTAFSGVFQHNVDLPFTNTVNITEAGYTVVDDFTQYLSHYHTAHLPAYGAEANEMHTLFFGGISQFYVDATGNLVEDTEVPFVRTISRVTRAADGTLSEEKLPQEMPGYLGASAEFLPAAGAPFDDAGILDLDALPAGEATLVGYVYGGIESSAPNVFFSNEENPSWASNYLFGVYLTPEAATGVETVAIPGENPLRVEVFPNPAGASVSVRFRAPVAGQVFFQIMNAEGRIVDRMSAEAPEAAQFDAELDISHLPDSAYVLSVQVGKFQRSVRFFKQGGE